MSIRIRLRSKGLVKSMSILVAGGLIFRIALYLMHSFAKLEKVYLGAKQESHTESFLPLQ